MKNRIYLSSPHLSGGELENVKQAFLENWVSPVGPHVSSFEKELCDYVQTRGGVALSSGTAGIHLALKLLNVTCGDVVFCSSLTFVASVNPILYQGAIPVLIDSEPKTWNMSPSALTRALKDAQKNGEMPKAVIVVSLYGQSADMDQISAVCAAFNVPIIEDAAESLGASYKGKMSGTIGKFGIYSFNGNKIITTSGGGMLISNEEEAIEKARFWASQAREPFRHYEHQEVGYNYRLSNISAGIGRAQLKVLPERIEARRDVFEKYFNELKELPGVTFMPEASFGLSTRWLTALIIDGTKTGLSSNKLIQLLEEENIEARPVWKPMHLQPLLNKALYYSHEPNEDVSYRLFTQGICLPSGSNLSDKDQERVIHCIQKAFSK